MRAAAAEAEALNERMLLLKQLSQWSSIALALAAAYFWYRASVAKVTRPGIHYSGIELRTDDPDQPGHSLYVIATAMEQSRLNKIAALLTGIGVLLQALGSVIPE